MQNWPLSLNENTFNALKNDFDQILRRTLNNMQDKSSEQSEITVKVKIALSKELVRDFDEVRYKADREILRPRFDHKISSVLQIKDETSGTLSGNYELVWDEDVCNYAMREITDEQISLDELTV